MEDAYVAVRASESLEPDDFPGIQPFHPSSPLEYAHPGTLGELVFHLDQKPGSAGPAKPLVSPLMPHLSVQPVTPGADVA